MVGVALFGDGAGAVPLGAEFLTGGQHIPDAVGKIVPLFNDGAPGGPDRRLFGNGQHIPEGLQILPMEGLVADLFHIIGGGGPLGVDVEHDERIKAVAVSDALHGF